MSLYALVDRFWTFTHLTHNLKSWSHAMWWKGWIKTLPNHN
jgi:hypothetical protein